MKSVSFDSLSFLDKMRLLLLHPQSFFDSVKSVSVGREPVVWSFLALLLFGGLNFVLFLLHGSGQVSIPAWSVLLDFSDVFIVIFGFFSYVLFLVLMVVGLPLLHSLARKFGGKGSVTDTKKALFYPWVLFFLLGWIPVVGWIIAVWASYLVYVGFRALHGLSMGRAIGYLVVATVLVTIAYFIVLVILIFLLITLAFMAFTGS
ncbi:MAG: YIP1 family protein [archaeon]|mgnify:CR=1 FL=1